MSNKRRRDAMREPLTPIRNCGGYGMLMCQSRDGGAAEGGPTTADGGAGQGGPGKGCRRGGVVQGKGRSRRAVHNSAAPPCRGGGDRHAEKSQLRDWCGVLTGTVCCSHVAHRWRRSSEPRTGRAGGSLEKTQGSVRGLVGHVRDRR